MRKIRQLTIQIADRPGRVGELTSALWEKGVNIEAFTGVLCRGKAIIHLTVDKLSEARDVFVGRGWNATEEMVAVRPLGQHHRKLGNGGK